MSERILITLISTTHLVEEDYQGERKKGWTPESSFGLSKHMQMQEWWR